MDGTDLSYLGYQGVSHDDPLFGIPQVDRRQHLYTIGRTGSGKTTLLRNLIIQDIEAGRGLALIDPHGDLAADILEHIPAWRTDEVIVFDPSDLERPLGLNVLAHVPLDQRPLVADNVVAIFRHLWGLDETATPRLLRLLFSCVSALRAIVRRDSDETYREMLKRMAKESGIETPSAEDLVRLDRKRKGKTLSNADWVSTIDPEAKIAKMKDGTTHLAYKPEHAVDLDTGVVVAAVVHSADEGDTTTLPGTLKAAAANLGTIGQVPTAAKTIELIADKGYHSRAVLKDLDDGAWKTRIAEPQRKSFSRWHGDEDARAAVYANRNRLRSKVGKAGMRKRAEIVERSFAHNLERGGMRRTWLRGRENVHKRYLIHVAGHNLGILMRLLIGAGTPKEAAARGKRLLLVIQTAETAVFVNLAIDEAGLGILVVIVSVDPA